MFRVQLMEEAGVDWSMQVTGGTVFFVPVVWCTPGIVNDNGVRALHIERIESLQVAVRRRERR